MISVIVPAFNVESTITKTIDSILSQTYKEIEIIVVNDGSSDATGRVIDDYASTHEQIIIIHTSNHGVTTARLVGVEHASGDWIGFVDGDDEIEPDMYELLLKNAKEYGADISHCGYQMIFSDGRINYFHNTGCLVEQDKIAGIKDLLEGSLVEPGLCNKLFHKSLFHKLLHTSVMDKSIKINEDLLMNFYLFSEASKSIFEDKCKYHYLVHSGSVTRRSLSKNRIFDPIKVKKQIMKNVQGELLPVAQKAFIGTCISVYNTLVLNGIKEYKKEAKKIQKELYIYKKRTKVVEKKQKVLIWMILHLPYGYEKIYRFYAKYFLNNRYE